MRDTTGSLRLCRPAEWQRRGSRCVPGMDFAKTHLNPARAGTQHEKQPCRKVAYVCLKWQQQKTSRSLVWKCIWGQWEWLLGLQWCVGERNGMVKAVDVCSWWCCEGCFWSLPQSWPSLSLTLSQRREILGFTPERGRAHISQLLWWERLSTNALLSQTW